MARDTEKTKDSGNDRIKPSGKRDASGTRSNAPAQSASGAEQSFDRRQRREQAYCAYPLIADWRDTKQRAMDGLLQPQSLQTASNTTYTVGPLRTPSRRPSQRSTIDELATSRQSDKPSKHTTNLPERRRRRDSVSARPIVDSSTAAEWLNEARCSSPDQIAQGLSHLELVPRGPEEVLPCRNSASTQAATWAQDRPSGPWLLPAPDPPTGGSVRSQCTAPSRGASLDRRLPKRSDRGRPPTSYDPSRVDRTSRRSSRARSQSRQPMQSFVPLESARRADAPLSSDWDENSFYRPPRPSMNAYDPEMFTKITATETPACRGRARESRYSTYPQTPTNAQSSTHTLRRVSGSGTATITIPGKADLEKRFFR